MKKTLLDFIVVLVAVIVGLFLYDKFFRTAHTGSASVTSDAQDRRRMLQSDFQRAADGAKTAVAAYYTSRGAWPMKNEDAGLAAPDFYRGESLRKMEIMGPVINLTFGANSGVEEGRVTLNAEPTPNMAMGLNWGCISPNITDIAAIFPNCKYVAR